MLDKNTFTQIFKILEDCFETKFYRNYNEQFKLLKNENYKIIIEKESDKVLGFLSYWEFNNFLFLEHLAISPKSQGKGIGSKLFKNFFSLSKLKILEVEPPLKNEDKKRIKFYENLGMFFNNYEYYQPPYRDGDEKSKLFLMSSTKLTEKEFNSIVEKLYKNVYNIIKDVD